MTQRCQILRPLRRFRYFETDDGPPIDPPTVPGAPTTLQVSQTTPGVIATTFVAPADDGGSPIRRYTRRLNGDPLTDVNIGLPSPLADSFPVTPGQVGGVRYLAVNDVGPSDPSIGRGFTAWDVPGLTVFGTPVRLKNAVQIPWTLAPSPDTPLIEQEATIVRFNGDGSQVEVLVATDTDIDVTGLGDGELIELRLRARNGVGWSDQVSLQARSADVPGVGPAPTVTVTDNSVEIVSVQPGDNGGLPFQRYRLRLTEVAT